MAFQLVGKLHKIGTETQITESYSKREFVIIVEKFYKNKEDRSYPVKFQFSNNKCMELDSSNIQDALRMHLDVKVDFDIYGKEDKNGNVWVNLNAISIVTTQPTQSTISNQSGPIKPNTPIYEPTTQYTGDLPF